MKTVTGSSVFTAFMVSHLIQDESLAPLTVIADLITLSTRIRHSFTIKVPKVPADLTCAEQEKSVLSCGNFDFRETTLDTV